LADILILKYLAMPMRGKRNVLLRARA